MSTRISHNGLPTDLTPFRFKLLIRQASAQLGLSKGAIRYLEFALENSQPGDFLRGKICAIWHSLDRLARLFGVTKRQIGRIEAELIHAGLIVRTYPERKGRSGNRENGEVKRAAGINLAPLIERAEQIRAMATRQMINDDEGVELCEHIKDLFRQIRALEDENADRVATDILPRRRPSELTNIAAMKDVAEALEAVLADFSSVSSQPEMSVESDKNVRLITKTQKKKITRMTSAPQNPQLRTTPWQARMLASKTLTDYINLYASGTSVDWRVIMLATRDRAYELGISSRIWQESCMQIGESRTALCLIVVDRNASRTSSRYEAVNPAAAFTGLTRKEAREFAVLDRLVSEMAKAMVRAREQL